MAQKMIIDTDTASDDAVALVLALTDARVDVLAVTVVSGNVPLSMGVQNALYTLEQCGSTVPVLAGADRPLVREHVFAHDVHGADGMGDIGLPLTGREPVEGHAVDRIIELARAHPGEITLVTLGPLTNLALALRKAPDIAGLFARVVMMAGTGDHTGNVTPTAEFNVYVDPEAADIVFTSGLPLEMVGWDVSRNDATITPADSVRLAATGPLGEFCTRIQRQLVEFCREVTHIDGFDLPDPVTMAVAIDPSIALRGIDAYVRVETAGTQTLGMTVVDHLGVTQKPPNTRVVLAADRERFVDMLLTACAG
ncbi:nucleoside hydrolase [Cellulomonas chengniuliangii]|uniref:Nucleoside hydrolase n=1 Tax=Cellulomonas chengniuliangii TaxID=2968084 RepID=A0ABY5L046_9CELL|nr:nucleoside hydrolase [Cellulomonas chengniuliangii]MCC2307795.1 nucleoside hydrolase [Cellulomonas chengniuliangii]UUI75448.1 nucleoside hydrolase [Cellulomonas chengniuliangii]